MARLAFWPAPLPEYVATKKIRLSRSTSSGFTSPVVVTTLDAMDYYGEWVTYYIDNDATTAVWYRVEYLDASDVVLSTGPIKAGEELLGVTPADVFPLIQGLPRNAVDAELVQLYIRDVIAEIETRTRMKLSSTTVVEEVYSGRDLEKIFTRYYKDGRRIVELRHFPIISIDKVQYRVRSTPTTDKIDITTQLDIEVVNEDAASGYNHGQVSIFPKGMNVLFGGVLDSVDAGGFYDLSLYFDYKHGYASIPNDLQRAIRETVAGSIMEVAGESGTAGVSSQSMDGMSESFTASATTTVFSARRIYYDERAEKIIRRYIKPLWA